MEISEDDIRLITKLIAEKLGSNASPEKIRPLVAEAIGQLSIACANEPISNPQTPISIEARKKSRLIINALGLAANGLDESLRDFLSAKNIHVIALSSTNIGEFASLIAIIDYSEFKTDINRLKFELSELCEKFGYKTIVQDSAYYGY